MANQQSKALDELTRLAFIRAEQWERSLAEAWHEGSKERKQSLRLANRFRKHRLKTWGKTALDKLDDIPAVPTSDLRKMLDDSVANDAAERGEG